MTDYQKYLKTLSDRDVSDLWVRYCAPRERTRELTDLELSRAYDIHYENEEREEEKWRERGCYPEQGDYPDPLD